MKLTIIVAAGLALAAALPAAPAAAQGSRTFVSGHGSDANNCTLATPCRTLVAAFAVTIAGGEIDVLDAAGYGTLTINKAISIVNDGVGTSSILVPSGGTGITINAGPSDAVNLRGLTIEGGGAGTYGIYFNTGGALTVTNSVIRHLVAEGIHFAPSATSKLLVSNTLVADNTNSGIVVQPSGSGVVTAVLNRVAVSNNAANGFSVFGQSSTGTVKATVLDSVATGNSTTGFYATSSAGHAPATLMLFSSATANNTFGLFADGPGATLRAFQTMATGNTTGWSAQNGGVVQSYGNNAIDGNTGGETAPPSVGVK